MATASCIPGGGASSAASSPMPSTTSSRRGTTASPEVLPLQWARARMRAIRSNSPAALIAGTAKGDVACSGAPACGSALASGADLVGAPQRGGPVEHAVDVGVAVVGAKALGGLDRLVDHHP